MATPEHLLIVHHGPALLGLDLAGVREVVRMLEPQTLPGAPAGVLGVMNLRGEMVPIVALEERLPARAAPVGLDHHLVVVDGAKTPVAIAVDHVEDIEAVLPGSWKRAGDVLPKGVPLAGMARTESGLIPVLDPASLLDAGETMALDEAVKKLSEERKARRPASEGRK